MDHNTQRLFAVGLLGLLIIIGIVSIMNERPAAPEKQLAKDGVDYVPSISFDRCLDETMSANPNMDEDVVRDNCLILEAVNTQDVEVCGEVSAPRQDSCHAQFD